MGSRPRAGPAPPRALPRRASHPMPGVSDPASEHPLSYPAPPEQTPTWTMRLARVFTWWSGATVNTRVWTRRFGEVVGYDEFGNTYYRTIGGKIDPALGFERRWVIYRGESEGSATPPGWYGWLHHQTDEAPPRRTTRRGPGRSPTSPT